MPDANHPADADGGIRPVPEGYRAVTPWIISRDTAGLLDFVKEAFGAEEIARVHNEDGTIGHAEFRIGDSIVMAFDAREGWPDTPGFFRLYVEEGDAVYRRALEAGAMSVTGSLLRRSCGAREGPSGQRLVDSVARGGSRCPGDGETRRGEGIRRCQALRPGVTRSRPWRSKPQIGSN